MPTPELAALAALMRVPGVFENKNLRNLLLASFLLGGCGFVPEIPINTASSVFEASETETTTASPTEKTLPVIAERETVLHVPLLGQIYPPDLEPTPIPEPVVQTLTLDPEVVIELSEYLYDTYANQVQERDWPTKGMLTNMYRGIFIARAEVVTNPDGSTEAFFLLIFRRGIFRIHPDKIAVNVPVESGGTTAVQLDPPSLSTEDQQLIFDQLAISFERDWPIALFLTSLPSREMTESDCQTIADTPSAAVVADELIAKCRDFPPELRPLNANYLAEMAREYMRTPPDLEMFQNMNDVLLSERNEIPLIPEEWITTLTMY